MGVLFFMIGQGSHGFYTIAASTNIRNFPTKNKGKVMGTLAALYVNQRCCCLQRPAESSRIQHPQHAQCPSYLQAVL